MIDKYAAYLGKYTDDIKWSYVHGIEYEKQGETGSKTSQNPSIFATLS